MIWKSHTVKKVMTFTIILISSLYRQNPIFLTYSRIFYSIFIACFLHNTYKTSAQEHSIGMLYLLSIYTLKQQKILKINNNTIGEIIWIQVGGDNLSPHLRLRYLEEIQKDTDEVTK